jgi:hypothetical protein
MRFFSSKTISALSEDDEGALQAAKERMFTLHENFFEQLRRNEMDLRK